MKKQLWIAAGLLQCASVYAQDNISVSDADYRSRYGHAEMNISCTTAARSPFERGLLQMHSFAWQEARASFQEVTRIDPDCAMAWWGIAMTFYDGLHEHPSADEVELARAALASAWKAKTRNEREAAWISAAEQIFRGYPEVARVDRDQKYSEAMSELYRSNPDDHEAAAFYSLSLLSLARRKANDRTLQMQAAAILEPLLKALPDHPGVAHYLIHAYDDAGQRAPGMEAARRYAAIAPVLTHPQHMPAHIFAGLGMWQENNQSNAKALEADPAYYHALMYLVYGKMQLGQRKAAADLVENLRQHTLTPDVKRAAFRGLHSANTWLLLEGRDWQAAADAPAISDAALDMLDTFYIRGIGAARSGNPDKMAAALKSLQDLVVQIEQQNDPDNKVRLLLAQVQIRGR
jgi:tetratricopeptide (TPR) repeat protein